MGNTHSLRTRRDQPSGVWAQLGGLSKDSQALTASALALQPEAIESNLLETFSHHLSAAV